MKLIFLKNYNKIINFKLHHLLLNKLYDKLNLSLRLLYFYSFLLTLSFNIFLNKHLHFKNNI